ncbi:MAG: hypothetical protein QHH43_07315 [Candidatus Saccharicenans sp.]|jgi:hypothetical protein|nr:hypothetical protein [Candidatus Saccharicenans sp.]MDH7575547.1 hypothetical protein [Candidatus Saccharicenans sp.]
MSRRKVVALLACFFWLSASLAAQVKAGGYFSFEYLKSQPEGLYSKGTFANFNGGLAVSGVIYGSLSFLAEGRLASHENFQLAQAYINFQGSQLISLKAGLFEIPFGRFNRSARPHENPTVFRPLVFHFFPYRWNDLGICLQGNYAIFYYSAYIINGLSADSQGYLETKFTDPNKDKAMGGRLGLRFGEGIELGGSIYNGKYDPDGTKDVQFRGLDLLWLTPEWEVRGEFIQAAYDHPTLNQKINFEGYYLTVSMLFKSFRLYYSFQKSDLPRNLVDDHQAPPLNIFLESMVKKTRSAVGLKWDAASNFYAKLEYDWNKEKDVKLKDNVLLVQVGLAF